MDSNYVPLIKQEFLNENENIATFLSDADINIPIKNEPILDEDASPVTIKYEKLNDAPFASILSIKNENQLETQLAPADRFVIYELETPQIVKQTKNIDQNATNANVPSRSYNKLSLNLNDRVCSDTMNSATAQYSHLNNAIHPATSGSPSNTTTSNPILLNTQLRKRNKIVLPVSALDKRTRYNIEGTSTKNRNSQISGSPEISSVNPPMQTSSMKIINHLIKHKHVHKKQEIRINEENLQKDAAKLISTQLDSSDLVNSISDDSSHRNTNSIVTSVENNIAELEEMNCKKYPSIIESPRPMITFQDNSQTKPDLTPVTKKYTPAAVNCELRVKCLCRLTVDSSKTTDNSELIGFFNEMFEKTRHLTKKQQRIVKMSLLQSISEAENAVEQGKCCCF